MPPDKHTQFQRRKERARRGILLLTFCALLSVHGVQLSGWLIRESARDHTTVQLTRVSTTIAARTARLLRRLSRPATADTSLLHPAAAPADTFPPFGIAVFPVEQVPDWGAMTTPQEWNRRFEELPPSAFVPLPAYDLRILTLPLQSLLQQRRDNTAIITAKLTYSTRYFGAYDIDAHEFTGNHPGIDIKLAEGTPIRSVAGGRVQSVSNRKGLGRTVIVEHRHPTAGTFFSVYGHLEEEIVREGQDVAAGDTLGTVGMTGTTTAPHLHLQIDRGTTGSTHVPYFPFSLPSPEIAALFSIHPVFFVTQFGAHSPQEAVAIER